MGGKTILHGILLFTMVFLKILHIYYLISSLMKTTQNKHNILKRTKKKDLEYLMSCVLTV